METIIKMKFKRIVKESYAHPNAEAAVNDYRTRAQLEEGVEVKLPKSLEIINEYAFKESKIKNINFDKIVYGAKRFIIGLAKKVLIANSLGELNSIFLAT